MGEPEGVEGITPNAKTRRVHGLLCCRASMEPFEENEGTADFLNVIPRLNTEQRDWLRNALLKLHPVHPWLNHV